MTENNIKDYFKRKRKDPPIEKYGSFNFLIYLAKVVDLGTAETLGRQIASEKVESEIYDSIIDSIIGYN